MEVIKIYREEKTRNLIVFYEIFKTDVDFGIFFRNTKNESGWLGFRDSIEDCEKMLPSDALEVV